MPIMYGEEKSDQEVKNFVEEYVRLVMSNKHDRFYAIMSLVPTGKRILDYGCGWGHFSIAMRDKDNTVEAIDISQNEIDICNLVWGKQPNINYECKKIDEFVDSSFDCVLSNQVIEHVHNVGNYLSATNRVLKNGGQLIISLPNIMNPRFFLGLLHSDMEDRLKSQSENQLKKYAKTHDHINAWDPIHFVTLCASVGFLLDRYIPTEGIAFPFRKPFKPYVYTRVKSIANLSYTMTFSFKKVKDVTINPND